MNFNFFNPEFLTMFFKLPCKLPEHVLSIIVVQGQAFNFGFAHYIPIFIELLKNVDKKDIFVRNSVLLIALIWHIVCFKWAICLYRLIYDGLYRMLGIYIYILLLFWQKNCETAVELFIFFILFVHFLIFSLKLSPITILLFGFN